MRGFLVEAHERVCHGVERMALAHTGGHRMEAAQRLGWGRNTLTRKIQELGLEAEISKRGRTNS